MLAPTFRRYLCSTVAWLLGAASAGADARFERLGVEHGLPGTYVIDLAQDNQGFLWIADDNDGLIRYDGYDFRAYRHDPANPRSISSNAELNVYVDRSGTLWVGSNSGLNRYDARTDDFSRITTKSVEPAGLSADGVGFALVDSEGRLWVGTVRGLNRLDPGEKRFKQYHVERGTTGSMAPDSFWTGFEDSGKRLWFGTLGGGLLRYDPATDSLQQFVYERTPESPPVRNLRSIAQDRSGKLWLAGEDGLATLDPDTMTFRRIHWRNTVEDVNELGLPDMLLPFWSVAEAPDGHVWLATYGAGVFRIAPDRKSWVRFRHDRADPASLSGDDVWKVFIDHSGQHWFAAAQDGLNRFNPLTDAIEYFAFPGLLDGATLKGLAALPDGRLAAGTSNHGAWVFDPAEASWTPLDWPTPTGTPGRRPSPRAHRTVEDLWVTSDASIWVAGNPNPSAKLFRLEGEFAQATTFPQAYRPSIVYLDRQQRLWIATPFRHLARVELPTGARMQWAEDSGDPHALRTTMIWEIFEDRQGRMWFGNDLGLDRMDPGTGQFRHYDADPGRTGSLPAGDVRLIVEDERGELWVSSDAGVSRYDRAGDAFESFPLPESPIDARSQGGHAGIVKSQLWWGSATGLTSFDLPSRRYRSYGPAQGVPGTPKGVAALPDGRLALAYADRIGLFSPDRVLRDPTVPRVSLTAMRSGNRLLQPAGDAADGILRSSAWTATEITLPHDHEPVTFEFAALHFAAPARNRYAYRLEGVDASWLETDARNRRATYTTLPPGRYEFRVRAANPDGLWNVEGLAIALTVLPPWWMTWWAYALYGLLALFLLMATSWYRTRSLRSRADLLESQVAARTEELVEQKRIVESQALHLAELADNKDRLFARISHEFRTPLTVIMGPIERLQALTESDSVRAYLASARRNAGRLLRLVDQLLGLARLRSGHSEPTRAILAAPIIRQVTASFESLAASRDLDLSVEVIDDIAFQTSANALETIAVNLVSNAIKYRSPGRASAFP